MSTSNKPLIVVFGATGAQGGSVVEHLLKNGLFRIRGITRDASSDKGKALAARGVEVVSADVSKPETLPAAFAGAYGAFVVTNFWDPSSMGKEHAQGIVLVDAAKAAGVTHFQYAALPNVEAESKGKYNVPHFTDKGKVAEYAKTKGFAYTSFPGASFYYQNFAAFFPPKKEGDTYVYSLPETSTISAFDVNDIGGVSVASFLQPQRWNGDYLPSTGDHLTPAEYVRLIGEQTGKKVKLNVVPRDVFAKFGFPGAHELAEMFGWFDEFTYHGRIAKREEGIRAFPDHKTFRQWLATGALKLD
jgi:uncharacterized protein YbjT (DUF2867 family)